MSSPYDLSQKVKEANTALNQENIDLTSKESKIKFKEDLVDYEPEFSYEEASSIESEDNIDDYILADHVALEKRLESTLILKSFDSTENNNEDNVNNEREENINDEISEELETNILSDMNENFDLNLICKTGALTNKTETLVKLDSSDINSEHKLNVKQSKTVASRKSSYVENIYCNQHCIERIDCSNTYLRKVINLKDGMVKLPRLKLHRRKCCEKNKFLQKLPCYTGLRSEYGLNTLQLQRRDNIKEIILMKGQEKKRRTEENKLNKSIENESIFCNWLKTLSSRRKFNNHHLERLFKPLTHGIIKNTTKVHLTKQRLNTTKIPQIKIKQKISDTTQSQILMCNVTVKIPPNVIV